MIEFLCPNGHRIHCPADQSGRTAKCPRCGVKFVVPNTAEAAPAGGAGSDSSQAEMSDSNLGGPAHAAKPAAAKEQQIEFLCPNGHHLHGPASLQGRPGACPECGSRFRIPVLDEGAEEAQHEEISIDSTVGREAAAMGLVEPEAIEALGAADAAEVAEQSYSAAEIASPDELAIPLPETAERETASNTQIELREPGSSVVGGPRRPDGRAGGHPLAKILAQLWAAKDQQAKVELHISGGDTLAPDHFARAMSGDTHGVFGRKESDGTWTVTVLAWDAVERIVVREAKSLPAAWPTGK